MNWYKISQNNKENEDNVPEWDYPGADHDYNPSWDYRIDTRPDQQAVQFVNDYIQHVKQNLLPQIGFIQDIKPSFIRDKSNILAKYISGTQPWVVMVINIEAIKKGAKKYKVNFEQQLEATIIHELAHAIQEGADLDFDEEEAENFAHNYIVYNEINNFWDEI